VFESKAVLSTTLTSPKQFQRNVLSNAGATAIGSTAQFLLVVVLARFLTTADFAGYLTAVAVIGILEMASDFGTRVWAIRGFALPDPADQIFYRAIRSKVFFSLLCALALLFLPIRSLSALQVAICFVIAVVQPSTDPFLWYLRGMERLDIEAGIVLLWRLGLTATLAILAVSGLHLTSLLGIWFLGTTIRMIVESRIYPITSLLAKSRRNGAKRASDIGKMVWTVSPMGTAFLLMALYQRLGVLTLGEIGQVEDVATFGAAFTLVASSGFIATSIAVASFPKIARAVSDTDFTASGNLVRSMVASITWVIAPMCILGIITSPFLIGVLYGVEFKASGFVMILLLPGLYVSCVNLSLKYVLNALGLNWLDAASAAIGIIGFFAILFAISGITLSEAAGIGWSFGEVTVFGCKWIFLSRHGRLATSHLLWVLAVGSVLSMSAGIAYFYFV